jgi:hypothetical protein
VSEPFRKWCEWCSASATHMNFYEWEEDEDRHSSVCADPVCERCLPKAEGEFMARRYDYVLPIVSVIVGSELHVALDCAFAELASLRRDERRAA